MRKLSSNMDEVLRCLTNEYTQFGEICGKYGQLQKELYGRTSASYVWKSLVSRVLNALIKNNLVEHGEIGQYRLAQQPELISVTDLMERFRKDFSDSTINYNMKISEVFTWLSTQPEFKK